MERKEIWTIGHSTRTASELTGLLQSFDIAVLADIRNFAGSRRYPHFNKEALELSLPQQHIRYVHVKDLGGRRKPVPGSPNTAWKHAAFRGYADYMATPAYQQAAEQLEAIAALSRTAIMCSEAVWWSCHRALVSDWLKARGWDVMHIMSPGKATVHPYTPPARMVNGQLRYDVPDLFGT